MKQQAWKLLWLGVLMHGLLWGMLRGQSLVGSNPVLPSVQGRSLAWGDYDVDGDPDLLVCGVDGNGVAQTVLLRNDNATAFVVVGVPFGRLGDASCAWGDLDGDGDVDLVLAGRRGGKGVVEVWRNLGAGSWAAYQPGTLPGVQHGGVVLGDLDGDGDRDVVLLGSNYDDGYAGYVLRNDNGSLVSLGNILGGLCHVDVALAPLAAGQLPSVWTHGQNWNGEPEFRIWGNGGGMSLAAWPVAAGGLRDGLSCLVDMEGDGDRDLLLGGMDAPAASVRLWENDGGGLSDLGPMGLPGLYRGDAVALDFDGDGLEDLVLAGTDAGGQCVTKAMRRVPGAGYVDQQPQFALPGVCAARLAVADWNGDGRPEVVLSGLDGGGLPVCLLLRWDQLQQRFQY